MLDITLAVHVMIVRLQSFSIARPRELRVLMKHAFIVGPINIETKASRRTLITRHDELILKVLSALVQVCSMLNFP